ncbi:NAD(P)/FAD-dependent oxidoreductase [Ramlibacter rhizophilus]|uniref:FAD-dependent oxidoreductase n=1 Tax=Ramlibacter rhizophilus TaxID=1781167 RepID=A0A4Z0BEH3_9BURK|nr:FAD-dependent oxidoreductase [Ramlibacter rhizophilus]TFY96779.1 FAD-dependent oxidoreductase [Ramlibacter rhizophilus]
MHVLVLGTGIVGTCAGAWLQRDGHQVTFVSPVPPGEACSFGNAGSLSPSACLPVGMPGMWKQVPGWLRDPDGPLRIRPGYLAQVTPWLLRFVRASRKPEVERISAALRGLLAPIFESYEPLLQHAGAQALVRRTGCLYVYSSDAAAARWRWGMELRRNLGVDLRDVGAEQLAQLEPDLRGRFRFGILAPENGSTVDPEALVKALHRQCMADGAAMVSGAAESFEAAGGKVRAVRLADGQVLPCDGVVVATGAWSRPLAAALDLKVPLETQRGYHVTVHSNNLGLRHTVMAPEYNLMVNPMAMGLRLAGSVEFAGLQPPPDWRRADVLLAKGREMFPQLDASRTSRWMGHRPCLPDSLPVIGRAPRMENAWLAFGHGHVGMCGGATTGREIAHLVAGRPPQVDLAPFRPDRF